MFGGLCHAGNWASFADFGAWGWIGLILNVMFWVGLLAGLTAFVVWAVRRARVPAATGPYGAGQPAAKEILQARYVRGEISQEQYELMRQDIE